MNMDVKTVTKSPAGFARKRTAANDHAWIKSSPPGYLYQEEQDVYGDQGVRDHGL
jgi:hypothetical protein